MNGELNPKPYLNGRVAFDGVSRVNFGENHIDFKRQEKSNDCGFACLKMLGYKFPEQFKQEDLWNYEVINFGAELAENVKEDAPYMVLIETKQKTLHWIISIGELVIDPNRGVLLASEYERENIADILGFYKVPCKNRTVLSTAA